MGHKKLFPVLLALALLSQSVFAFDAPEADGYVNDQGGVLSVKEEMTIEARMQEIEMSTSAEIGVLILSTTNDEAISEVAFEVGNEWGVGKKENDNGLVIVIAVEDRAWFMATGYGLEGALPDAITKRIAEKVFPAHFREGRYAEGILAALDDIEAYLKEDPSVRAEYDQSSTLPNADSGFALWLMILVAIGVAKSIWVGVSNKKHRVRRSISGTIFLFFLGMATVSLIVAAVVAGVSALIDLIIISGPSTGGGGSSGSSSGRSTRTSGSSGSSSWGSSSGGGGFGGGSFGGGGSGGRW